MPAFLTCLENFWSEFHKTFKQAQDSIHHITFAHTNLLPGAVKMYFLQRDIKRV